MSASDPISEKVRWALMRRLIEVLGEEEAETLMESLPPVVWHQLATKDDLAALEERLRAEMNGQFALLRGEFAELKGEFAELKGKFAELEGKFAELEGKFAELEGKLTGIEGKFAELEGKLTGLEGKFALQLARTTRTMVVAFISVSVAMLGAMAAIVHTAPA